MYSVPEPSDNVCCDRCGNIFDHTINDYLREFYNIEFMCTECAYSEGILDGNQIAEVV